MPSATDLVGEAGEMLAEGFLRLRGLYVRERRLRVGRCEIDLLAEGHGTLVVVEVKLRHGRDFGGARGAVGYRKRAHLLEAATRYLATRPLPHPPVRFDLVAITVEDHGRRATVEHVPNAFQARAGGLL